MSRHTGVKCSHIQRQIDSDKRREKKRFGLISRHKANKNRLINIQKQKDKQIDQQIDKHEHTNKRKIADMLINTGTNRK